MSKQHKDFAILVRGKEQINALVAVSHDVFTPATQTEPAFTTEHLTLVYLEPNSEDQAPTGEGLRNSIKIQIDVPPVDSGGHFGWKDIGDAPSSMSTADPEAAARTSAAKDAEIARLNGMLADDAAFGSAIKWREYAGNLEKVLVANGHPVPQIASDETRTEPPTAEINTSVSGANGGAPWPLPAEPSAADLDAAAHEEKAKLDTGAGHEGAAETV